MLVTKNLNYKSNKKLSNIDIFRNKIIFKKNSSKMNAGIYMFNKKIFRYLNKKNISLEEEILPYMINKKIINGEISNSNFIDIGEIKNLKFARKEFFKKKKSAVFLDRDGVLNKDYGYVSKYKDFVWTKGIFKTLKFLNKKFDHLFLITNQSGIGRGYFTENQFVNLQKKIKKELAKKNIFIDDVFYCPHHPTHGKGIYKKKCLCRKPKNLLIENAITKWNLDRKKIIMIGDKETDMICAKKSRINFKYYKNNFYKILSNVI